MVFLVFLMLKETALIWPKLTVLELWISLEAAFFDTNRHFIWCDKKLQSSFKGNIWAELKICFLKNNL